jgi:hypothetical protein
MVYEPSYKLFVLLKYIPSFGGHDIFNCVFPDALGAATVLAIPAFCVELLLTT